MLAVGGAGADDPAGRPGRARPDDGLRSGARCGAADGRLRAQQPVPVPLPLHAGHVPV